MSVQEAHAGALADALSMLPGGQEGAPGTASIPATAIFHPADPAIRLGPTVDLRDAGGRPLSGAHVRIDAVHDGEAELLLYDLGGSRILPSIDYLPTHGVLDVHFVGIAPAETYARLLSSLRYINRAPHPTPGERSIEISVLDAGGAETRVGRMDLTVMADQPQPRADIDTPEANDIAAGPVAHVVWNAADGSARAEDILGWHRAGEVPRHSSAVRGDTRPPFDETNAPAASDAALGGVTEARDAAPAPRSDDPSVFGDEALHLYGAAKLPLSWDGRGVAALSQAGSRGAPGGGRKDGADVVAEKGRPVDYLRDGSDEGAPLFADGEYRIYSAGTSAHTGPPSAGPPSAGPTPVGSPGNAETGNAETGSGAAGSGTVADAPAGSPSASGRLADGAVAPWATPIDDPLIFQVLRPSDVFETDGAGAADPVAARPVAAIPRLDAFLVGLPPSGDPLLPADGEGESAA